MYPLSLLLLIIGVVALLTGYTVLGVILVLIAIFAPAGPYHGGGWGWRRW